MKIIVIGITALCFLVSGCSKSAPWCQSTQNPCSEETNPNRSAETVGRKGVTYEYDLQNGALKSTSIVDTKE